MYEVKKYERDRNNSIQLIYEKIRCLNFGVQITTLSQIEVISSVVTRVNLKLAGKYYSPYQECICFHVSFLKKTLGDYHVVEKLLEDMKCEV